MKRLKDKEETLRWDSKSKQSDNQHNKVKPEKKAKIYPEKNNKANAGVKVEESKSKMKIEGRKIKERSKKF